MKVALVHDQLKEFGGAERVFIALKECFPDADVYTSFYDPKTLGKHAKRFEGWHIKTSWVQKIPYFGKIYSPLRFLAPYIWESLNFRGYDLVISSSGWYMSKGIITAPETTHICYIHHQPRYLYYYETAMEWQKYPLVRMYAHLINNGLRIWDFLSSQRPDSFIANSKETKARVHKFYRRHADVIYPPVSIPQKMTVTKTDISEKGYYLTLSRLTRAKHINVLIRAANKYGFTLKIGGSGSDLPYLKSIAGPTVEFLGTVSDADFHNLFAGAKAFLNAAIDEEFGISVVEAMGHGLPVIGYASGGVKETINDGENGYLYAELTPESLYEKIKELESLGSTTYTQMKKTARKSAEQYSLEEFKKKIHSFVTSKMETYKKDLYA